MMLAISEKRWEPSYNADLTVTWHGLIVSQFLTKAPTDYHHFRRALAAVLSTLGRPGAWVGDGHYGTQEDVLLAHRASVVLYAPLAGAKGDERGYTTPRAPRESRFLTDPHCQRGRSCPSGYTLSTPSNGAGFASCAVVDCDS